MKLLWKSLLAAAFLAVPLMPAQTAQDGAFTVSVDHIALRDIGATHLRFDVFTRVTSRRKTKIKRVRFEQMRLDGLPVYLGPVDERLEIEAGKEASLPPIGLTLYYRDLNSLTPLEEAVRDGRLTVAGEARVDLDLNLIERVLSRDWDLRAAMPISMSVPLEVPGGAPGRIAALAALRAADTGLSLGTAALGILMPQSADELRSRYLPSLVVAESRYTLRLHDGREASFRIRGLGYRLSDDKFVVTDEMLQPWHYDVVAATALSTGDATLGSDHDLLVWPADHFAGAGRSLAAGQIVAVSQPGKAPSAIVPDGDGSRRIHLAERDADSNIAILRFTSSADRGAPAPVASESTLHESAWDRLSLFRLRRDGSPAVISTPASRANNRIVLADPVDDAAFGSLVIAPDGAVGMVQDESSAMILHAQ